MKHHLHRILFATATVATLITGCSREDVVDLDPINALNALENPRNIDEVEGVLSGAYAGFRSVSYYGTVNASGPFSVLPDMMSDNLVETVENLPQDRVLTDWIYTPDVDQIENMSRTAYVIIARANLALRDVDKYATADNQARINRIKGQALAIRAHVHFDMMRYFSTRFDRNSTSILAMAYNKEFRIAQDVQLPRLNNKEYYDNIFADLTQAAQFLQNNAPTAGANTRPLIDYFTVRAMQARINLYAEQWADAITASTEVINARPLVALADSARFAGMYNETNRGEIIWNVQFDPGQGGPGGSLFFPAGNRNSFRPAEEVATLSGTTGFIQRGDIRYNAFFRPETSNAFGTRLTVSKYNGKAALRDVNTNFIVFRTGEMYLIRAEARARSGQELAGLADLNFLRSNRIVNYVPVVGLTGAALLDAIANERRAELFAEGHRWFDLKRTTRTIQRTNGCGNRQITPATRCTLAPNAREWAWPIPFIEFQTNPNIVQNPGYN